MEDAKKLLEDCANNLLQAVTQLNSNRTSPSSTNTTTSIPSSSSQSNVNTSTAVTQVTTPLNEHRRLFGYMPPQPRASTKRQKGSLGGGPYKKFVVKNTWTHVFVCLRETTAEVTPKASEKMALTVAGLGEKRITFDQDISSHEFHALILKEFPGLDEPGGGYEILRTEAGRRQLVVVPTPSGGFRPSYLQSVLGQAKAYLRPIQCNLPLEMVKSVAEVSEVVVITFIFI
jgi:hypothetical protein